MRSRNIKPGFFKNEYLAQLSPHARLLFAGLWLIADRRGRLEDRPLKIKGELFPLESVDIKTLFEELANSEGNFITRYSVDNQRFIQVENFHRHQNPHIRETESVIPPEISEKHSASTMLNTTKAMSSPADSLLLIPDSLTPESEADASAFVGLDNEAIKETDNAMEKFAQEGMEYLVSLNSPNHSNPGWVKGYLSNQLKALAENKREIPQSEIMTIWREVCHSAIKNNAKAVKWFTTAFESKIDSWTPKERITHNDNPVSGQSLNNRWETLKTFPYARHIVTGEIFKTSDLKPDGNGQSGVMWQETTYYCLAHLEGVTEEPSKP